MNISEKSNFQKKSHHLNVFFVGDIFGKTGRKIIFKNLKNLIEEHQIDFVVANGENATHGRSLSPKHYQKLKNAGIDVFTMGNHVYERNDIINFLETSKDIIRPANFLFQNNSKLGCGTNVFEVKKFKIRITNLLGRNLMNLPKKLKIKNPFLVLDKIVSEDKSDFHFVDFHAESTAEKIALAWNFDGKISGLYGTHTHVPTADFRILPKGSFFISDLGMVGGYYSVIGAKPENVIYSLRNETRLFIENADFPGQICGMILTLDTLQKNIFKMKQIYKIFENF